jgi:molybdenum cofactor sulfurtransferase
MTAKGTKIAAEGHMAGFLEACPEYVSTSSLDRLRETEYSRLDASGQVYLDFTGSSLYAQSQLREHLALLSSDVLGNPHSVNPTSTRATELVESARRRVLEYFNASGDEYVAIFTANSSASLKLVAESYPFRRNAQFLLTSDNHNSVNGIREYARRAGATVNYVPLVPPALRTDRCSLLQRLHEKPIAAPGLFAYPAQSNFTGVQHPFTWISEAQDQGWHVLMDCSAYVATNSLDLSQHHPDFVPLSFYKMFGYPTGVGCLLARRQALETLERPWFAGGTVIAVTVEGDSYRLASGHAGFEDGTLNFLALPAVEIGLDHLAGIGMDVIHTRVRCLTTWLLDRLGKLRHKDGTPAVRVYGPAGWEQRGATIALNFLDGQHHVVDERKVDKLASDENISLRTGCFCNPGAGESAFGVSADRISAVFDQVTLSSVDDYIRVTGWRVAVRSGCPLAWSRTFAMSSGFSPSLTASPTAPLTTSL